jgi:hypothetical protein
MQVAPYFLKAGVSLQTYRFHEKEAQNCVGNPTHDVPFLRQVSLVDLDAATTLSRYRLIGA